QSRADNSRSAMGIDESESRIGTRLSFNGPSTSLDPLIPLARISYSAQDSRLFSTLPAESDRFTQSTAATSSNQIPDPNRAQFARTASLTTSFCTTPSFAAPNTIVLGNGGANPVSVAVADFNSDGKPDVVTANQGPSNISVLLGNGAGGFGGPNTISLGADASGQYSLALGDFNRDGRPDVVTANFKSNNITVLLGNGAGGFGTIKTISLGAGVDGPVSVAVSDFNGDGKPDVMTANFNSNNITVLLGNGAGGFGTPNTITLGADGKNPYSLAVGDFNGGGKPDVVTVNYSSDNVTVLLGNGAGGFGTPKTTSLGADAA